MEKSKILLTSHSLAMFGTCAAFESLAWNAANDQLLHLRGETLSTRKSYTKTRKNLQNTLFG